MNLERFNLMEFTRSSIASRHGIDNSPGKEEIKNLRSLWKCLLVPVFYYIKGRFEQEADSYGESYGFNGLINLTSGYRSKALNRKVGSKPSSQHTKGEAADFVYIYSYDEIKDICIYDCKQIFKLLKGFHKEHPGLIDQCILEHCSGKNTGWIHLSHKRLGENRGQFFSIPKKA